MITVVVVEDQPDLAEALRETIEFSGEATVVGVCHTLGASVEMVAGLQPAVIVSDFRLPDGDSADVMTAWLASAPHTKILVVSAWTDQRSIARATTAGASAYLEKGPQLSTLADSIIELMAATDSRPQHAIVGASTTASGPITRASQLTELLAARISTREAADRLGTTEREVRRYLNSLRRIHGVHTRAELYACAMDDAL